MERFKQSIVQLENDVAELKRFQKELKGSTPTVGDIHYCTSTQEFGEYSLDEIDTFRFAVAKTDAVPGHPEQQFRYNTYTYRLLNPTPELAAHMQIQKVHYSHGFTDYIPVDTENFENYCMKKGGYTKVVITDEIRKCLDSKLWEFVAEVQNTGGHKQIDKKEFYADITIEFKHAYKISPHISFYVTPISHTLDECKIHEITTKQVVFRIKYGNFPTTPYTGTHQNFPNTIFSGLKLHYSITGVVEQNNNLLD